MRNCIGIRRETIDEFEKRAPLIPKQVERLVEHFGLRVIVEPSSRRVFSDADYTAAGAEISADLTPCGIIFGVKEIPVDELHGKGVYCFFSHTIKAQRYNMPMLRHIIDSQATLLDYELVTNDYGRRLIFFGDYAGYAGMIDTLWALGQRLDWEGVPNPFSNLKPAHEYASLEEAESSVREVGRQIQMEGLPKAICPFVCLFTGSGQVSHGARHIYNLLPTVKLLPDDIVTFRDSGAWSDRAVYGAVLTRPHLYRRYDGGGFDRDDFEANPKQYVGALEPYLHQAQLLINAIYWSPRYPRLVTRDFVRDYYHNGGPLRVIGDISCDIGGSIEITLKATTSGNPVFVYDVDRESAEDGVTGNGPVVLSVDKLPSELPREASESFGAALMPFIMDLARADFGVEYNQLEIPAPFKRAVIAHDGKLTDNFRYLGEYLLESTDQ